MDRYNDLHLVSGDMMEAIVQIQEATNDFEIYLTDTEKLNRELSRTSKLMQKNLNQVRMRPFSDLLKLFPRALRDLEIQYNKKVELQTKGGSTLLEKTVLETLNDPLLHLLRNAFDHGIENTETRKKLGKPEVGTIKITAAYRGNQTVITVSDDGKGIDLAKIRDKVQKKLGLDPEEIAQTTQKELLDLIFEPGFSTSEQVTDLSGRGVGMDVVRHAIEKIGGNIVVETKQGEGTKFILTVPFTLSVVRVLLVETQKMLLAFPSNAVEEVNLLDANIIVEKEGKEFLNWDEAEENRLPLIRLNQYLKFAHSTPNFDTEAIPVISEPTLLMIEQENDLVALMVDRYWGEQEVAIRPVEGKLKMPPGFTSCTILGDGRVVPLIDAVELLNWIDGQKDNSLNPSFHNLSFISSDLPDNFVNSTAKKNIMVIDDSINVRRFLALTFSQQNYHVEQAKDGQDALEKLQAGIPIQAIICDIEMPRLDGYGFLAHLKSNPKFQNIPVVMLTSRSSEKHRKMAMNLGAVAYFSKPFQEKELLTVIQNFVN
jgi:chemosensory pili system protein ChpA (sensor histidine kinase/response regulator)